MESIQTLEDCQTACSYLTNCTFFFYDKDAKICKVNTSSIENRVCDMVHGTKQPALKDCLDAGKVQWSNPGNYSLELQDSTLYFKSTVTVLIQTIIFIFSQFNQIISIEITICKHDIDCKTDKFFSSADRKSDYWLSYEYSILVVIIFSILIELLMYKLTLIAWNINDTNSNCKKERVCYIQNFCMKVLTSKFHKLVIKWK